MRVTPCASSSCCHESSKWKRVLALKRMEKESKRLHEHAWQESIAQMPQIARPDVTHTEAANAWRTDRLTTGAHASHHATVRAANHRRRCLCERRLQPDAQALQDLFEIGRDLSAASQASLRSDPEHQPLQPCCQASDRLDASRQASTRERERESHTTRACGDDPIRRLLLRETGACGAGTMAQGALPRV